VADFIVGELLGKSLGEVRALGNAEVVEWMAFLAYRAALEERERAGRG
jgi:hypothetical protein